MKWKSFPHYWPLVSHWLPIILQGLEYATLILAWTSSCINSQVAGDLRRQTFMWLHCNESYTQSTHYCFFLWPNVGTRLLASSKSKPTNQPTKFLVPFVCCQPLYTKCYFHSLSFTVQSLFCQQYKYTRETLKTESHHGDNIVVIDGTGGCHYDNHGCLQ